jgi:hypothetical protein
MSQQEALRELVSSLRDMGIRYRKWAAGLSGYHAEEYRQLAASTEQSAN